MMRIIFLNNKVKPVDKNKRCQLKMKSTDSSIQNFKVSGGSFTWQIAEARKKSKVTEKNE